MLFQSSASTNGIFEINDNTKPFSEWNKCSIKFPTDITKNWFFKFKGKHISKDISFLYNNNNIGDTLIFWDSVDNIIYNFEKSYFTRH